jgi:hypothetical protein
MCLRKLPIEQDDIGTVDVIIPHWNDSEIGEIGWLPLQSPVIPFEAHFRVDAKPTVMIILTKTGKTIRFTQELHSHNKFQYNFNQAEQTKGKGNIDCLRFVQNRMTSSIIHGILNQYGPEIRLSLASVIPRI